MKSRFSRRSFLEAIGASAALLPLVGPDKVLAAVGAPKRVVILCWTNGYPMDQWRPGAGFSFGEILKPLEPFKAKTIVVDGVGQKVHYEADPKAQGWNSSHTEWYGGHDAYPAVLTGVPLSRYGDFLGWSGGDSIDQYIAMDIGKQVKLPFESLVLAASKESSGYYGTISYKGKSTGITGERNPWNLFKKLFSSPAMPGDALEKAVLTRKSVLDHLGKSIEAFGARLGGDDKHQIQTHLASIRDIEKQLANGPAPGAAACAPPTVGDTFTLDNGSNMPKQIKLMNDLIVAAFKCDLTRVATFTLSNAGGDDSFFPFLGSDFVGKGDEYPERQYHDITHKQGNSADHKRRKTRVEQWFFEQAAYLAGQFEKAPEATGGNMLDNTLVVVTNSMGNNHDSHTQPFTLVGNLGGYFKTGQAIKASNDAHNRVLVAIANGMGVDGSKWGSPKYAGELASLKA